jgi:hypothetical protein
MRMCERIFFFFSSTAQFWALAASMKLSFYIGYYSYVSVRNTFTHLRQRLINKISDLKRGYSETFLKIENYYIMMNAEHRGLAWWRRWILIPDILNTGLLLFVVNCYEMCQ